MKKNGTSKSIILFLILLVCISAVVLLGTEVFQVKEITVLGNKTIDSNVIINLSGIIYGDNMLKVNKRLVSNRVEGNSPYPIVEKISFKLPDEVIIEVKERTPVAVIPYLSSYVIIDENGFIIDIVKQELDTEYPVIEGLPIQYIAKGASLVLAEDEDAYKQKVLFYVLDTIYSTGVNDLIQVINMDDPDDIKLITNDNIEIALGQALDLEKKLGWLKSDAYANVLEKDMEGTMDVSIANKAVFTPNVIGSDQDSEDDSDSSE